MLKIHKNLENSLILGEVEQNPLFSGSRNENVDFEIEKSSFQTLAGKFAAKEALIKALNYSDKSLLKSLEVLSSDCGKPYFNFRIDRPKVLRDLAIHLSISHDNDLSCAFVVIESP